MVCVVSSISANAICTEIAIKLTREEMLKGHLSRKLACFSMAVSFSRTNVAGVSKPAPRRPKPSARLLHLGFTFLVFWLRLLDAQVICAVLFSIEDGMRRHL